MGRPRRRRGGTAEFCNLGLAFPRACDLLCCATTHAPSPRRRSPGLGSGRRADTHPGRAGEHLPVHHLRRRPGTADRLPLPARRAGGDDREDGRGEGPAHRRKRGDRGQLRGGQRQREGIARRRGRSAVPDQRLPLLLRLGRTDHRQQAPRAARRARPEHQPAALRQPAVQPGAGRRPGPAPEPPGAGEPRRRRAGHRPRREALRRRGRHRVQLRRATRRDHHQLHRDVPHHRQREGAADQPRRQHPLRQSARRSGDEGAGLHREPRQRARSGQRHRHAADRDLVLGIPQSVPVLVRRPDQPAVGGRRGRGQLRGDQPGHQGSALRLAVARGRLRVSGDPMRQPGRQRRRGRLRGAGLLL